MVVEVVKGTIKSSAGFNFDFYLLSFSHSLPTIQLTHIIFLDLTVKKKNNEFLAQGHRGSVLTFILH